MRPSRSSANEVTPGILKRKLRSWPTLSARGVKANRRWLQKSPKM